MSYTPQGLVTVAFLKTQLDAGRDHLSLFEPLVLDALNQIVSADLVAPDVRDIISQRTNLSVPIATLQTLLGRFTKQGFLARSGGCFHKTDIPIPSSDLLIASSKIRADQLSLGEALIEHSRSYNITFESSESAVQALASFISSNKLEILLQNSPVEPNQGSLREARNLARFITERCIPDPILSLSLTSLLEGILLADVLLMKDISDIQMKFSHCLVYLDTPILLSALGLNGTSNEIAAKEGLAAIRNAGAQTVVFERTIEEIRGILHIYEEKLATNQGRLDLYPGSMTSYIISSHLTSAGVKVIDLDLEHTLTQMAIQVHPYPLHISEYTLDEEELTRSLSKTNDIWEENKPRVRHDVDCVAAILTLRAGQVAYDMEHTRSVFSTTSGLVVKNVQQWYMGQNGTGLSPVVHHAHLTTLAWLKKPARSLHLKLHELAAICITTMRPTEAVWQRMLGTLRQYVADGRMSDDESVAIVANGLTESLLSKLDDDFEPDAGNINDAIERVRDELRREHLNAANLQIEEIRTQKDTLLEAARIREENAKAETAIALQAASDAHVRASQASSTTEQTILWISHGLGQIVRWLIFSMLAIGTGFSATSIYHSKHLLIQWIITGSFVLVGTLNFFSVVDGWNAKSLGIRIETVISSYLRRKFK